MPPTPPGEAPVAEKIVFLRDGFSHAAFVFGPLWLLWRRAWLPAVAVVAGPRRPWRGGRRAENSRRRHELRRPRGRRSSSASRAARLLAWSLQRTGYVESDVVIGDNEEDAEVVYFERPGRAPAISPRRGARDDGDHRLRFGQSALGAEGLRARRARNGRRRAPSSSPTIPTWSARAERIVLPGVGAFADCRARPARAAGPLRGAARGGDHARPAVSRHLRRHAAHGGARSRTWRDARSRLGRRRRRRRSSPATRRSKFRTWAGTH